MITIGIFAVVYGNLELVQSVIQTRVSFSIYSRFVSKRVQKCYLDPNWGPFSPGSRVKLSSRSCQTIQKLYFAVNWRNKLISGHAPFRPRQSWLAKPLIVLVDNRIRSLFPSIGGCTHYLFDVGSERPPLLSSSLYRRIYFHAFLHLSGGHYWVPPSAPIHPKCEMIWREF